MRHPTFVRVLWLVGGAGLALLMVLLPIAGRLGELTQQLLPVGVRDLNVHATLSETVGRQFAGLAVVLKQSPWLPLFGTAGLLLRREWKLLAVLGLMLGFMLLTKLYVHRAVYLLPCLAAGFADLLAALATQSPRGRRMGRM